MWHCWIVFAYFSALWWFIIDIFFQSGLRPIHLASQLGHSQMVELLLARNADGTELPVKLSLYLTLSLQYIIFYAHIMPHLLCVICMCFVCMALWHIMHLKCCSFCRLLSLPFSLTHVISFHRCSFYLFHYYHWDIDCFTI